MEEDEARVKHERDRIAMVQSANKELAGELAMLKAEGHTLSKQNQELFKENRDMKDQLRTLNENLRRETDQLVGRDRENNLLRDENNQLKKSSEQYREDTTGVKGEQARLIENLRQQLEETRARIVEMKDEKQHEFKKIKERHDDQRRREADQYTFELEKLRNENALSQKRLGQEEHFSKELAIINNKLQNNLTTVKSTPGGPTPFNGKVPANTFYDDGGYDESDDASNEDLLKRKRAWADLEREQEEVKRNIKSILKTAPESRVMDDPIMADRVRGVRYAPQSYQENEEKPEAKRLKEALKKEESKANAIVDNSVSHSSSFNTH